MNAPLLLLLWNVGAGLAFLTSAWVRRNWPIGGTAACAVAVLGVLILPLDSPGEILGVPGKLASDWVILGRVLILDEANRIALALVYLGAGILFALGGDRFPSRAHAASMWAMLGLLSSSLMIRPFLLSAVLLELAALAGAVLLSEPDSTRQESSMRLVTMVTPAMLAVLLAGWFVDTAGVTSATPDLARSAASLLFLGFAILLAIPPFHLWFPSAVLGEGGLRAIFILVALQTTGVMLALSFLENYDWLRTSEEVFQAIRTAGLLTTGVGAAVALAETDSRKATAYSLLADSGPILLALGVPGGRGVVLAVALSGLRLLGIGLATSGWGWGAMDAAISARRETWANLYGRLSLAGFPLTPAFAARVMLLVILAAEDRGGFAILAAASIAGLLAAYRTAVRDLVEDHATRWTPPRRLHLSAVALGIVMSLVPGPWFEALHRAASGLMNLVP